MTSLLYMLRQLQGTELLLSYFLVMEQMSELKITICMSLSSILILLAVDIKLYMKNASAVLCKQHYIHFLMAFLISFNLMSA